jgi:hypothetical protein
MEQSSPTDKSFFAKIFIINPPENFKSELTIHHASILVPRAARIGWAIFIERLRDENKARA